MSVSARRVTPLPAGPHTLAAPTLPAAKSDLNRLLILAALAPGQTRVGPRAAADDVTRLVRALEDLGVAVREEGDGWVVGALDLQDARPREVHAGEGGTTSRFLMALASRRAGPTVVRGGAQLARRPVEPLLQALRALGARAERGPDRDGELVVAVQGPWRAPREPLAIDVATSSQFASALLLCAPPDGLALRPVGAVRSRPYVDLTLRALTAAGAAVEVGAGWTVRGASGPCPALRAALDASSATYPAALAALRGRVRLPALDPGQADARFPRLLADMGARVDAGEDGGLEIAAGALRGIELDAGDCPDLVPALCAVAAGAAGETRVLNAAHLRSKESDRVALLVGALRAFGVPAEERLDGLWLRGLGDPARLAAWPRPPVGADHRLAMTVAVLGRAGAGAWVEEPGCVGKSWPGFWGWLEGAESAEPVCG